ncbi:hypothetical protein WR25_03976 [Diploscapter pachys]|uniref:Uncharacterized protein n=1 Tax=Diploscapter pachys TaxID=2018661 RepID=A0A2A2LAB7_9BILA|nr:hypothetical protein WR25_03976 [Diploscapter pachys]
MFVARFLLPDVSYDVKQLNAEIHGLYLRQDTYYLGRNYVVQLFQSILREYNEFVVAKWAQLWNEVYSNNPTQWTNNNHVQNPPVFASNPAVTPPPNSPVPTATNSVILAETIDPITRVPNVTESENIRTTTRPLMTTTTTMPTTTEAELPTTTAIDDSQFSTTTKFYPVTTKPNQLVYRDILLKNLAKVWYGENDDVAPNRIEYWNKMDTIAYMEGKSDDEKLQMMKEIYSADQKRLNSSITEKEINSNWKNSIKYRLQSISFANSKLQELTQNEIPERVRELNRAMLKVHFSHEFYEADLETATEMVKKTAEAYSDEDLLFWHTLFTRRMYTELATLHGKRVMGIFSYALYYHKRHIFLSPKIVSLVSKRVNIECDNKNGMFLEEKLLGIKPIVIRSSDLMMYKKSTPEEAEKLWEKAKINEKKNIENCEKTVKKFQNADPRVNQLFWDLEKMRLSIPFFRAPFEKKLKIQQLDCLRNPTGHSSKFTNFISQFSTMYLIKITRSRCLKCISYLLASKAHLGYEAEHRDEPKVSIRWFRDGFDNYVLG